MRFVCVCLAIVGCSRSEGGSTPPPLPVEPTLRGVPTPALDDVGSECADVGAARACWTRDGSGVLGVHPATRTLPAAEAPGGFRCSGSGADRICDARVLTADAFRCNDNACTQRYPRLPDDGEWECADLDGVVVCHGGAPAAGVMPARPARGWFCGPRRGAASERVCVDFAPDRPLGEPWSCRFQYEPGAPARSCTRGGAGALGRECGAACPFGSVCEGGHCLPERPEPACWLDRDCGPGERCAHGSCRGVPR